MTPRPEYYTPAELAERWGCCLDLIYSLLKSGKLKGFKLGHGWRITDDARLEYETCGGVPDAPKPKLRGTGKKITRLT